MRLPPLFLRKGDCRERSSWEGMHIQIFGSRFSDFSRHMLYTLTSVAQLCPTLCDPIDCSMPGFPVHHQLLELAQTHVHPVGYPITSSSVVPYSSHLQSFTASGYFPMSQLFCIRWPKYWSFSFSSSPSNEYSGLIVMCQVV